jgi:osmotically-inducible protein OsmY
MRTRAWVLAAGLFGAALPLAAGADNGAAERAAAFVDENITKAAVARIGVQRMASARVNADAFHRHLLLTGEVPDEATRAAAEKAVSGIPEVQGIANELVVGPIIGISTRTRDSWITSEVKFRLLKKGFGRDMVRVVTEGGTVYLMGRVSRKDGSAAAEVASTTDHVARVVLVFEYVN